MTLTRRSFVLGTGAAALTLPLGAVPARAASRLVTPAGATSRLVRSRFSPLVGSAFRMTGPSWSTDVVLEEVGTLSPSTGPGDENRFSLLFRGAVSLPAAQGTYRFRQSQAGTADLFSVPVDRGTTVRYYQAIVNRAV